MGREANQPDREPGRSNLSFGKIAKYLAIGLEFTSAIFGSLVLGYLIDLQFNTSPWFAMAAAILGFIGAVGRLMRNVRRLGDRGDAV